MSVIGLVIFAVIGGAIGVVLAMAGRSELERRARIRGTATTPARDVTSGFAEVKGVVEAADLVTSPFYQVPAVLVRWKVEEYRRRGKSSSWCTVLDGTEAHDFWIRDETGRVHVPAARVRPQLYLAGSNTTSSGTFRAAPEHIESFLSRHGRSSEGWIFNKSMRYTEECIQPGEHIYALGWTERDADGPRFTGDPSGGELILANLTEEELSHRLGSRGRWMVGGGSLLGIGALGAAAVAAYLALT